MEKSSLSNIQQFKKACGNCSLATLCLPVGLDAEQMILLDDMDIRHRTLQRNEHLFLQGDEFKCLYAIRSGSFKSFSTHVYGSEQVKAFYFPGELVGFDAICSEKHAMSVIALETAAICELPFNKLLEISAKLPPLQRQLFNLASQKVQDDFCISVNSSAEERMATFLLHLSERFKMRGLLAEKFHLTMSREDIGSYLGIATETVSRILKRLQEQEIITVDRREIEILNFRKLQKSI